MAEADEVTVQVTITERVRYGAVVKMPREKFVALDNGLNEKRGKELRQIIEKVGDFCDRYNDWQDADDLEIEDFHILPDSAVKD